ncbi:reverse transcriptase domain-containing protein [Flavobacteriaceae sp. LMIT009]
MKEFDDYYTDAAIIRMLCKHRARISHKRHKKHMVRDISKHARTNKIKAIQYDDDFIKLQSLFPTRRNWRKLNQNERATLNNSIEKNFRRLWKSYLIEKSLIENTGKEPEKWYINLENFCKDIRAKVDSLTTSEYKLKKPEIFPLLKSVKHGKYTYRPIAKYSMVDKIITSGFAKYLTDKFDKTFHSCSFAFRAKRNGVIPSHHDSVVEILKYRKRNKRLWVAECDIQKFFDTVQHLYLEKIFLEEIEKLKESKVKVSDKAIRLFQMFLDSYSFNKDVLIKNSDPKYFKTNGVAPGEFGWVKNELAIRHGERYLVDFRIGIPQGNAVSCFIANLILNKIDESILKSYEDILYVRYCDDMVIAHPDKDVCKDALEKYKKGIDEAYLLYHKPKKFLNYKTYAKDFWTFKSKEPYFWGNKHLSEDNVPWLSFVGYQINYKGEVRVRKSSLKKEKSKQVTEIQKVLFALGMDKNRSLEKINSYSRKTKNQIIFSLEQRLISMSVGRVTIYNYNNPNLKQGLCWTNGFKHLNKNSITIRQLKELDRCREQQISYLKRQISHLDIKNEDVDERPDYMQKQNLFFGTPFSYYYKMEK